MLEFKPLDNRPTHELQEVITLDDLRKAKQEREQASAEGVRTHRAAIWLPKKQKGTDGNDAQPTPQASKGAGFVPTAAARQQLATEKPAILQRMDDTVARCRIARDNRNYRLNSLGVFEDDKNEVRARSMQRVQVHKDLSTTSMRLPDTNKDIKIERPNNSVEAKLERMCNRVIASLPEQPHKATPLAAPRFARQTTTLSPRHSAALRSGGDPGGSECSSAELLSNRISRTSTLAQGLPARGLAAPSRKATATNMSVAGGLAPEQPRDVLKDSLKSTASRAPPKPMASHRASHPAAPAPDQQSNASHYSSKPRPRTRPRSAGPLLKFSPFTTSLGAGTGRVPHRPKSIFRPKQELDQPVYGRRRAKVSEQHSRRPSSTGRASMTGDAAGAYGGLASGLAQAHNRYLDAATEENVARYYKLVSDAQLASLQRHNLSEDVLGMSPEQLQEALEAQLKAERTELEEESQRQNRVASGALNPASSSSLAKSALEHCSLMNEELDVLKKSLPETGPKFHSRRKKPSIPMSQGGKSMAGLGSGPGASTGSDSQSETGRTYGASELSDWEGDGRAIAGSDGDVLAGWALPDDPSGMAGLSFLRKHEQQRRNELLRPPPSTKPGAGDGGAEEEDGDMQHADAVKEEEQRRPDEAEEGKRGLQEHQTFNTKRLNAFKAMLEEAEAVPMEEVARMMPALPSVPTSPSVPLHIQTRLERLWTLLQMPLPSRLDAVLEYTKHSRLLQFEHALKVWEQAAVAVLQREGMIDTLLMVQKGVEEGTIGFLTVSALERQCVQLVQITSYLEQLKRVLKEQYCIELTYQGKPYPEETQVSQDQLLEFMEWLKDSSDSVICLS